MLDHLISFLGHGGFKLLVVAFIFVSQFARARAKIAKKRDAQLRGNTQFDDLSAPASFPSPLAPPTAIAASPWSNLDAFDGKKP